MPKVQKLCPTCNHYYDASEPECPYCNGSKYKNDDNSDETVCSECGRTYDGSLGHCPYCNDSAKEIVCSECRRKYDRSSEHCIYCGAVNPNFIPPDPPKPEPSEPTEIHRSKNVVGWLVCTAGSDKGRDFRLHVDNNFVGRGAENDIILADTKVSRQRQFSVVYDAENDTYFAFAMGGGTSIVRVNGQPLGGNIYLMKGDKLRIEDTTLVFIPLEKSDVQWDWEQ